MDEREDFRDCALLGSSTSANDTLYFAHWRCLSTFAGYPDDLALQLTCVDGAVHLWLHSQARLAGWDHNDNDARVRLLLGYALQPDVGYPFAAALRGGAC